MKSSVKREFVLPHSQQEVWNSLTDSAALADWMYPNDFEPRVGHRFTFHVPPNPKVNFDGLQVQCEVLLCNPPTDLLFSWEAGEVKTQVSYRLESEGQGTKVLFEQSGFEQENAHRGAQYGWQMMHGKLANLLSKGMT
jgi:uncharacterized protein YndB with AHSA1/START domain